MSTGGDLEIVRGAFAAMRLRMRGSAAADPCAPFAAYRARPVEFVREVLGEEVLAPQEAIMRAVYKHRRVTIRSAHRTGKSHAFARLAVHFMATAPSIVIAISPVEDQNKEGIFAAVRKLHAAAKARGVPLPGEPNMLSWEIAPKHYMTSLVSRSLHATHGRHTGVRLPAGDPNRDLTEEEMAQFLADIDSGIADETRVLLLFDEAASIAQHIFEGFSGTMASPLCYAAMAANPVCDYQAEHDYSRSHHPGSGWWRMKIAAIASDDDPVSADEVFDRGFGPDGRHGMPNYMLPLDYAEQSAKKFCGTDNPMYLGKVLGQFSRATGEDLVVTWDMLSAALERDGQPGIGPRMGVDVSESRDRCAMVLFFDGVKCGEVVWRPEAADSEALMTVAAKIAAQARAWGASLKESGYDWNGMPIPGARISVDATGLGSGVCARLAQLGIHVDRVNFGSKAASHYAALAGEYVFAHERARMHYTARRLLQEGMAIIPESYSLSWQEAQWAHWEARPSRGGIEWVCEKKSAIVARTGRSPDVWDADILAMTRETSTGPTIFGIGRGNIGGELMRRAKRRKRR